jgi:hypothetical protein
MDKDLACNFYKISKGAVMKKINPNVKSRTFSFLSFQILFILITSLITNPVAALGANKSKLVELGTDSMPSAQQPAPLIPSTVFSNPAGITVPDTGQSQSSITVSGTSGPISSMTLTLTGLSLPSGTQDLNILLVGPGGQTFVFFSDVGGLFTSTSNVNITLSDAAASLLPSSGALSSGTFKPTNYSVDSDVFNPPAPAGPYNDAAPQGSATFTSVYGGLSGASVNGTWTIYLRDDTGTSGATVTVSGGWSMDIVTTPAALPTTTTISSSLNPSNTNQAVTFTSTTTSSSTVNTGNVNFVDTTTSVTLCSNVPVNGSGQAQCLVPANTLSERRHTIQATYVGNATFSTSNGSLVQTVNFPTSQVGSTFTNAGGISIPDAGGGTSIPYPSNIQVSGLSGTISKVTLTLTNATFPQTGDFNFLLVGPGGQTFVFMSDAGGLFSPSNNVTLTFDDAAGSQLPNSGSIASGTYRPTDYTVDSENFPAPAPAPPYNTAAPSGVGTFASVYGGAAPNGTWSLYPLDDTGGGGTATVGSWSLTFTTSGDAPTTTVLSSNPNPSTTAQSVLFTANVTSSGNPVTVGNVTFRRGATVLCANVALNGSGVATCNAGPFAEGDFVATADYNGAPGQFNISSGSLTQQVNSPTVVSCLNFANNGGITIPNSSTGNPYPSRVLVSGLGGTISKVTVTLNGLTTPTPDDVDFLLVGPGGQKFLFMGDAGGANALSGVNITLEDAAASALPDSTAITSGTWRPASYTGSDNFPAPAPAAPYNPAAPDGAGTFASIFNGISPNGTWSLYTVEDAGDAVNTTLTGWSLTFTLAPTATTTSVTSSVNPSVFGQPVTFTATVATAGAGTPTGNVQFFDGATPIGSPVALNGSGIASLIVSNLSVASHTISVQYAGSTGACTGTFNSSSGSLIGNPQVVNKANTTTGVTSNQTNPVGTGVPVTFTATVSPVAPGAGTRTGTVTFNRNGSPVCSNSAINASGQANCTITFTIAGNYNIGVSYSGDGNFNASSSPTFVQQVIGPTAAPVGIGGRIFSQENGRAVYGARIEMIDSSGQTRVAITNPFGYFRFNDVPSGAVYTFRISAKGYQTQSVVREITDEVTDFDIQLENQ